MIIEEIPDSIEVTDELRDNKELKETFDNMFYNKKNKLFAQKLLDGDISYLKKLQEFKLLSQHRSEQVYQSLSQLEEQCNKIIALRKQISEPKRKQISEPGVNPAQQNLLVQQFMQLKKDAKKYIETAKKSLDALGDYTVIPLQQARPESYTDIKLQLRNEHLNTATFDTIATKYQPILNRYVSQDQQNNLKIALQNLDEIKSTINSIEKSKKINELSLDREKNPESEDSVKNELFIGGITDFKNNLINALKEEIEKPYLNDTVIHLIMAFMWKKLDNKNRFFRFF